jgi:hypothetical protein
MASVASSGASPRSASDVPDASEQEGEWEDFLQAGSGTSSIGWQTSPGSGSMASGYAVIGYTGQQEFLAPSPPAPSPLNLDSLQAQPSLSTSAFLEQFSPLGVSAGAAGFESQFEQTPVAPTTPFDLISAVSEEELNGEFCGGMNCPKRGKARKTDLETAFFTSVSSMPLASPLTGLGDLAQPLPSPGLGLPGGFQGDVQNLPWTPNELRTNQFFVLDDYVSPSPLQRQQQQRQQRQQQQPSASVSPVQARSPAMSPACFKQDSPLTPMPIIIRTKRSGNRIEKKKSSSNSSRYSSSGSSDSDPFRNLLQTNINTERPNAFECFEAIGRQSQKGRKGPLAVETKQNALQVRRKGACFCCHARKVKVGFCPIAGFAWWQYTDHGTV